MATSALVELQTDFITCPICFETLKKPKYLPCLHTFCEGCIDTFITSALENLSIQKQVGISCPICRQFASKPAELGINDWASSLPSNHVVNTLLDLKKATDKSSFCSACERENKTESATSWCVNCSETLCSQCVVHHKKFKVSANHEITHLEDLEKDQTSVRKRDVYCEVHVDEKIKAYCADHSAVCCMSCVMLSHRKCDDVLPIEEAADTKRRSTTFSDLEKSLSSMGSKIKNLKKNQEKRIADFRESVAKAKTKVKDVRRKLDIHLDKMERECAEKISQVEKETIIDLENQQTEIRCKQSILQNDVSILEKSALAPDALFLLEFDKVSKHKNDLQTFVEDSLSKFVTRKVLFEEDTTLQQFETAFSKFGSVSVHEENPTGSSTTSPQQTLIDMSTATPSLIKSCDISLNATGIAFPTDDSVIVSNHASKAIELHDKNLSLRSRLSLSDYPIMVRMHSQTEGSVVVENRFIQNFSINKNTLVEKRRVQIPCRYDFVEIDSKYYLGGVNIISVYHSDYTHDRDIPVEGPVDYMAIRDKTSFCYSSNSLVHCITISGARVFTYTHEELSDPHGIHIDQSGYIYVCDYYSKNIHQLTNDGRFVRIVVRNIPSNPYSICFSPNTNKLAVGTDNKLLVYEFS